MQSKTSKAKSWTRRRLVEFLVFNFLLCSVCSACFVCFALLAWFALLGLLALLCLACLVCLVCLLCLICLLCLTCLINVACVICLAYLICLACLLCLACCVFARLDLARQSPSLGHLSLDTGQLRSRQFFFWFSKISYIGFLAFFFLIIQIQTVKFVRLMV